ncbi:hypothetical protein GCM10008985_31090 [Halococcus dombrowskii]|uniref:Uncharacterized protein n=1 Tax=Halococcus dombrowskii TaxID=179637 RepID=A0AAV3SLU9_HALDO
MPFRECWRTGDEIASKIDNSDEYHKDGDTEPRNEHGQQTRDGSGDEEIHHRTWHTPIRSGVFRSTKLLHRMGDSDHVLVHTYQYE